MSRAGSAPLWPVLLVLVAIVAGVAALDRLAQSRRSRALVIDVGNVALRADADTDAEAGDVGPQNGLALAVSEEHLRARELARRGELEEALALFAAALEERPASASLHGELGYWLLVDRRPEEAVKHLRTAHELDASDTRAALNLSIALRRTEDLAGAETILRDVLAREPSNGQVRVALGTVLRRAGRLDEAVAMLREAATFGGNEQRAEALAALGSAYLEVDRHQEAAAAFEEAIRWAPANVDVRLAAGRAYLRSGEREHAERATAMLEETARIAPDVASVHALFGRALELSTRLDGAEAAYRSAIRLDPAYTYARRRLLRLALRRDDVVEARVQAERLLEDDADDASHHFLAGLTHARQGRPAEARDFYRRAIELSAGDYPEAWFNLGRFERSNGNTDAAIAAYEKALEQRPDYVEAWNNLGLARAAAGQAEAAEVCYRRAIELEPDYAVAWFNLSKVFDGRADLDGARDALEHAVRARPDYSEALLNLGKLHSGRGDLDDALATYERLVAVKPRYAPGWYNLSIVFGKLDRDADEYAATRTAVRIDREHDKALRKLAKLERKRGNLEDAEHLFLEILDRDPRDFVARLGLTETYRRLRRWPECARTARTLVAQKPSSKRARELADYCGGKPS